MKIAFLIDDDDLTYGGARPLINWARHSGSDCKIVSISSKLKIEDSNFINAGSIAELSKVLYGYDYLIVSDHNLGFGLKIKKAAGIKLAVYVQILFGMHSLWLKSNSSTFLKRLFFLISTIIPFRFLTRGYRRKLKSCDVIIANSENIETLLNFVYGIEEAPIVFPPVDTDFFSPSAEIKKDSILIFTGREEDDNNYSLIPKIVKVALENGLKVQVFGRGLKLQHLDLYGPQISINGRISDYELVILYNRSLVTICIQKQEFFGYVPIESLSCGTPVITLYRHDAEKFISNCEEGCIIRSDAGSIERDMIHFIRNSSDSSLREKCRRVALDFSVDKSTDQLKEALMKNRGIHKG